MYRLASDVYQLSSFEQTMLSIGEGALRRLEQLPLSAFKQESPILVSLWPVLKPALLLGFEIEHSQRLVRVYCTSTLVFMIIDLLVTCMLLITRQPLEVVAFMGSLGVVLSFYPFLALREHQRNAKVLFQRDFVTMLQHLAVMSGIGMHPQVAFNYWCQMPQTGVMHHMLLHVNREMQRGLTFYESWMVWQELMTERHVKRFIALMAQSSRHGLGDISAQLWQIVEEIAVHSKLEVKRIAEQVSAKLLVPMMISLIALLFVMIYPAMRQLEIFGVGEF